MIVHVAFAESEFIDEIVDVITAGIRNLTNCPRQVADRVSFSCAFTRYHRFCYIATAGGFELIEIGGIRAAFVGLGWRNNPEPGPCDFAGYGGHRLFIDSRHIRINADEHAPTATTLTDFHQQEIIACDKIDLEFVLEVACAAVDRVIVNFFAVKPDFDGVIAADLHRHIGLIRCGFQRDKRVGRMVVHVALGHSDFIEGIVDVIAAGIGDFTERPREVADCVAFLRAVCSDICFCHVAAASGIKRINIGRIRAAFVRLGWSNNPQPRTGNFILGLCNVRHDEKCHHACQP